MGGSALLTVNFSGWIAHMLKNLRVQARLCGRFGGERRVGRAPGAAVMAFRRRSLQSLRVERIPVVSHASHTAALSSLDPPQRVTSLAVMGGWLSRTSGCPNRLTPGPRQVRTAEQRWRAHGLGRQRE